MLLSTASSRSVSCSRHEPLIYYGKHALLCLGASLWECFAAVTISRRDFLGVPLPKVYDGRNSSFGFTDTRGANCRAVRQMLLEALDRLDAKDPHDQLRHIVAGVR